MADSLPHLPLFVDDYEAATAHLTIEEDGAYMRLLRLCWRSPRCTIPDDPEWIMRRMRVDQATYERVVAPIINEFFKRARGRIYQKRLLQVFAFGVEKKQRRSEAGKKGGIAKALKTKKTLPSKATVLPQANGKQNSSLHTIPDNNPPTPLEPDGKKNPGYAFEGRTIRLNQADFDRWRLAYHAITDLRAELQGIDDWLQGPDVPDAKRKNWFNPVSRMLGRKHEERLAAKRERDSADAAFEARFPPVERSESEWRALLGDEEYERRRLV